MKKRNGEPERQAATPPYGGRGRLEGIESGNRIGVLPEPYQADTDTELRVVNERGEGVLIDQPLVTAHSGAVAAGEIVPLGFLEYVAIVGSGGDEKRRGSEDRDDPAPHLP